MHPEAFAYVFSDAGYWFASAVALSALFVWVSIHIARKFDVLDYPESNRKKHANPVPLLGGVGMTVAIIILIGFSGRDVFPFEQYGALLASLGIIIVMGILDAKYDLPWYGQLGLIAVAAGLVFYSGVRMYGVTNPVDGSLFVLPSMIGLGATILWFWAITFTTKILDGLDGLVGSITASALFVIAGLTVTERWWQPDIGRIALIIAGACVGFLIWNWKPAKTYLGEAGAVACGFLLAWISVVSGSKLLTALMVLLIPLVDLVWTIIRRISTHKSVCGIMKPDRLHFHFLLARRGWSPQAVSMLYVVSGIVPGIASLWMTPVQKTVLVFVLFVVWFTVIVKTYASTTRRV